MVAYNSHNYTENHNHNQHDNNNNTQTQNTKTKTDLPTLGQRTVFCGNLTWSVSWQDLKDHLKQIGPVEYCEILHYKDGRKTGSGVARYLCISDAERAVEELKDSELKGRPMLIRADRENGVGPGSGKAKGKGKSISDEQAEKQIYIGNLSWQTTWMTLKNHFSQVGEVEYCDVLGNKYGKSAGSGMVRYRHAVDARTAIVSMQESELDGRQLFIREDREKRAILGLSHQQDMMAIKAKKEARKGLKKGGSSSKSSMDDGGKSSGYSYTNYGINSSENDNYHSSSGYGNNSGYGKGGKYNSKGSGKGYDNGKEGHGKGSTNGNNHNIKGNSNNKGYGKSDKGTSSSSKGNGKSNSSSDIKSGGKKVFDRHGNEIAAGPKVFDREGKLVKGGGNK